MFIPILSIFVDALNSQIEHQMHEWFYIKFSPIRIVIKILQIKGLGIEYCYKRKEQCSEMRLLWKFNPCC